MKKILLLQMRPENETCESEFEAILRAAKISRSQVHRIRVEQLDQLEIDINHYSAVIAGGSPFDVTCPKDEKSEVQKRVESFFSRLFDQILAADFPFLGICSGNGLL
jgi:GMP synthase (glutamine-hydrolysing)